MTSRESGKPGAGFAVMKSDENTPPKYPSPKILLIDLKDESEVSLKKAGFNVASGTFGTPYKVAKNDNYVPVIPNADIEDYSEQDIVVIDLVPNSVLEHAKGEKVVSSGVKDWWGKCIIGLVDPRPRMMQHCKGYFDRILQNGGIFVVFSDRRDACLTVYGTDSHYGFTDHGSTNCDNWDFLSVFHSDQIHILNEKGKEIVIADSLDELSQFFKPHLKGTFECSLEMGWEEKGNWIPIATNKFGKTIAGLLTPTKNRKGVVIVLPQIAHKSEFLLDLISSLLPKLFPQLFPHIEGAKWVERDTYELPAVVALKTEIDEVNEIAISRVKGLKAEIEKVRQSHGFLHDLIRETDKKLVDAVKLTLNLLGFQRVIDVDAEKKLIGDHSMDEDLRIEDMSPLILVEIKGVYGTPSDNEALQVFKHIAPRMKELGRHDVHGLSIINHQRAIPGLEREHEKAFREIIVTTAEKQDVGLMTTWDLYRLARSFMRNNWKFDQVKDVFAKKGRVCPTPNHYEYLGTIDDYWEKAGAMSIVLEGGNLKKGSKIAFELPVEFVEQVVDSLQLENRPTEEATKGNVVGIKTILGKEEAKKGIRVYLVFE